jgi:hypothetical protein
MTRNTDFGRYQKTRRQIPDDMYPSDKSFVYYSMASPVLSGIWTGSYNLISQIQAHLFDVFCVLNLYLIGFCCYTVLKHVSKVSFDCVWKKRFHFHWSVIICRKPYHGHLYEFIGKFNFKSVFHGKLNGFFFVNIVWATDPKENQWKKENYQAATLVHSAFQSDSNIHRIPH